VAGSQSETGISVSTTRDRTIEALITLLLQAEEACQRFYLHLMEAFAHEPTAAEVWWMMGADEAGHIRLLEQVLHSLSPEQRQAPADPLWLEQARSAARFSPEKALARIQTLEDAYQEAHALENSEINAVFEFVMTSYFPKSLQRSFVLNLLRTHVERLERLRTREWRQSVVVKPS
jgi:rubrerythrin